MPKLSIITTCYNVQKYVRESLESIFNQDFEDFELILVDDGSTDGTKDILLEYADRPNVRLLENKSNEGLPVSRNRALLAATGEYAAIHDADDVSLPHRFAKEVTYLDNHPSVIFLGGYAIKINDMGSIIGSMVYPPQSTEGAFKAISHFKLNPIIDPTCMYRRKVVLDDGAYIMDPVFKTVGDFHLWCKLLCRGHQMYNLNEPLIKYRINPNGLTRTKQQQMLEATDMVWASFKRKHFPEIPLRADYFNQEGFTEH